MYKKIFTIFLILICFLHISAKEPETKIKSISQGSKNCKSTRYQSEFAESWADVEQFIHKNWNTTLVDSSELSTLKKNGLAPPKPYFSMAHNTKVLFYWDNYFINKGLLMIDSLSHYAKNATDNLLWEVDTLGFVPNANMSWGMNRSQIPYLAFMVLDIYKKNNDKFWLEKAYITLKKEYLFWTDTSRIALENHNTAIAGLQRYNHHGTSNELIEFYNLIYRRKLVKEHPDSIDYQKKLTIGGHYTAEAEVMDFTPRFENRCTDFIAVDLNCNLYKYELIFDWIVKELSLTHEPKWKSMASKRRNLILKYCWDEKRGLFMDYDYKNNRFSEVASIASFYPLFAGIATKKQAELTIKNLSLFEHRYGVTVCEKTNNTVQYQWDFPAGWPPVYLLVIQSLHDYGYRDDALRICGKYLDVVTKNYMDPNPVFKGKSTSLKRNRGYIYEKYDVVTGGINDLEYPAWEFLGWSAGVYIWCLDYYKRNESVYDRQKYFQTKSQ